MKTTLRDMFTQAKRFLSSQISGEGSFPPDFHFASSGRPAYELVLDASPSMEDQDYPPSRFAAAQQAAVSFMQKCLQQTPEARVGIVFYAGTATVAAPLLPVKEHFRELHMAVNHGEIDAATNIGAGLFAAGQELMALGPAVSPAIVLLTDGHSNTGPEPVQVASQLKAMNVRLDIIGIGGSPIQVNEWELKQMASTLNGQLRYWFIRDTTTLVRKFEALALGKV
jgi:Ca-activated chloride channel homolog